MLPKELFLIAALAVLAHGAQFSDPMTTIDADHGHNYTCYCSVRKISPIESAKARCMHNVLKFVNVKCGGLCTGPMSLYEIVHAACEHPMTAKDILDGCCPGYVKSVDNSTLIT